MLSVARPPCDVGVIRGAAETPGCASHARSWVLVATILGSSVSFVEGSVITIALPAIQRDLRASVAEMQWIASAFTLLLAALTLVSGSAGDRFGRRRLFIAGLAVLAVSSVGAGLAATSRQLILARAIQGFGGALLVPNSLALLSAAFPKAERGRAIGTWSGFTALTGAAGPIVGGYLVDSVSWRAGFFLVVPLALVTLVIALLRVPDVRIGKHWPEIDWRGAALATAGLTALVYGIIRLADGGVAWAALALGLALLASFLVVDARLPAPMMPPRLFRSRMFLGANVLTLLLYFALTGVFFILPFELVRVRGYTATATGASYLPFAVLVAVLSPWAGSLVDHVGARLPLVVGPLVAAAGFAGFAVLGEGSYWTSVLPAMTLAGLGMAITVAPLTATVVVAVDESDVGIASGVNNTVARVAALIAVAVVGLLALQVFDRALLQRLTALDLSPEVRAFVAAQEHAFGDVPVPAIASDGERDAIARAVGESLSESFIFVCWLATTLAALSALAAAVTIESAPVRAPAGAGATVVPCGHLDLVLDVSPRSEGCEECLRSGSRWVHLRVCVTCGHVGCCDASRHRHATAHFFATSHPVVRSLEPGESWRWCYVDDVAV